MEWIFNKFSINGNEILYYAFWLSNILITVLALIFTVIELKKDKQ